MNKFIFIIILLLSVCIEHATVINAYAAFYLGLEPEVSTLDDTKRILGYPISIKENNKFIICKYIVVEVFLNKKTKKVSSIIIHDPGFRDVNGFMVGDSYEKISRTLNDSGQGNVIYDNKKRIIYLFDQNGILGEILYGSLPK